jgi:ubiquinone/menaquinone biosynthesis C-methylase UbiE
LPVQDFGRVADIYDATRSLPEGEMRKLLDALEATIPHPGPVIDVGVGTGRFAMPLQERGYDIVGIDVSKGMMWKAREKGVLQVLFADVHRIPFEDEAFEAALLVHILHLVSDWVTVVREAARVSRGTIITVIESDEGKDLRQEYRRMRLEMGYPLDRFEGGERGLRDIVSPDRVVTVLETIRKTAADDEIKHLEERSQSVTWDVPEDAHREIIQNLRAEHHGRKFVSEGRLELAIWSAVRLRKEILGHIQKG